MIRVSFESPLDIIDNSYNDYDYCLCHLLEENKEYKDYFYNTKKNILLDNSIFELGTAFDIHKFYDIVLDLKPNEYIVPDVLDNGYETIKQFEEWNKITDNKKVGTKIGVVQGRTLEEFIYCYRYMSENADKIALSFNCEIYNHLVFVSDNGYNETGNNYNQKDLYTWYKARPYMIRLLQKLGIWNFNKPHHLLGCAFASEFFDNIELYNNSSIDTLDTSNPVVAGYSGLKYTNHGIDTKPKLKLYTIMDNKLTEQQKQLINYNTTLFKQKVQNV